MYYGYYEQIEYKTLLKWCLIKHICVYVYQLAYIYIYTNYITNISNHFGSRISIRRSLLYEENRILFISWKKASKIIMEPEESIKII